MKRNSINTAVQEVTEDILAMSSEEFRAQLEQHKDGDIAGSLAELWRFGEQLLASPSVVVFSSWTCRSGNSQNCNCDMDLFNSLSDMVEACAA